MPSSGHRYLPVLKILSDYRSEIECPNGIDIWTRNAAGWSAFHWATYSGSKKVLHWLLESEQRRRTVEDEDEQKEAEKIAEMTRLSKEEQELEDSDDESYDGFMHRCVIELVFSCASLWLPYDHCL